MGSLIFMAAMLLIGGGLIYATKNRTKFGINASPPTGCPECGADLPRVRKPADRHELLWGGTTCPACGLKMDKWGNPRD